MPDSNELSERTYKLRVEEVQRLIKVANLTPARIASKISVDVKTLNKWLKGNGVFVKNIKALSDVLGVHPQTLIEGYQAHDNAPRNGVMSLTVTMDYATPEEFMYLASLLADVHEKFQSYKQQQLQIVTYYITAKDKVGNPFYYYAVIHASQKEQFLRVIREYGFIPDFAAIVEKGPGEPSRKVKDKMLEYYGFDHDEEVGGQ